MVCTAPTGERDEGDGDESRGGTIFEMIVSGGGGRRFVSAMYGSCEHHAAAAAPPRSSRGWMGREKTFLPSTAPLPAWLKFRAGGQKPETAARRGTRTEVTYSAIVLDVVWF